MTERDRMLQHLQANSIVALFGRNCETGIHDLKDLQNSLVYLRGSITGRSIGAPATDLPVKSLKQSAGS